VADLREPGGAPGRLNDESREIWDANAAFWDAHMGDEGNEWHRDLIAPAVERLLEVAPEHRILEVACGTGQFARRLSRLGAEVVAVDFSRRMVEFARARSAGAAVDYRVVDATDEAELRHIAPPRSLDSVVCNMALMDMAAIEPLFAAAAALLRPAGRLVVSQTHPCFLTVGMSKVVEEADEGKHVARSHSIRMTRYATPIVAKGLAIEGQPVAQNYFERPLGQILATGFAAGLVVDALEEPVFGRDAFEGDVVNQVWREIPPVLVVRFRPAAPADDGA
jgi:2-polyprenyl-3-methyl-5-hydroxy-6-metoxy-1,4-benzoquinol methylase